MHPVYWLLPHSHWIAQDAQESWSRQEAGDRSGTSPTCSFTRKTKLFQNPQQIFPYRHRHGYIGIFMTINLVLIYHLGLPRTKSAFEFAQEREEE